MSMEFFDLIEVGQGWIVVDKPANMSVHNDPGHDVISLLDARLRQDTHHGARSGFGPDSVIGPVHRLDRETSGVMLMGLASDVIRFFSKQFEQRTAVKRYAALVHGEFKLAGNETLWTYPLGSEAGGRTNPRGKGKATDCVTRVRLLEQGSHYALIECDLLTGRKHQIRRHAKMAGHPILGDKRYGSKRAVDFVQSHHDFNRLGLHSHSLTVTLPNSGETRTFVSPIPDTFKHIIEQDKTSTQI